MNLVWKKASLVGIQKGRKMYQMGLKVEQDLVGHDGTLILF